VHVSALNLHKPDAEVAVGDYGEEEQTADVRLLKDPLTVGRMLTPRSAVETSRPAVQRRDGQGQEW
jgi:hypothetical protein